MKRNSDTNIISILESFEEGGEGNITDGQTVKICGIITSVKRKLTRRDAEMAFAVVEDLTGSIEVIIFPKIFAQYEKIIANEQVVSIVGKVSTKEDEEPKILMDSAAKIDVKNENMRFYVKIPSGCDGKINALKEILRIYNGNVPVFLHFASTKQTYAAPREFWVEPCEGLEKRIKELLGCECDVALRM